MDLIRASARNIAAWHDWQLRAHGIECRYTGGLWTCGASGPATTIHSQAVTLTPAPAATEPATTREIR